MKVLDFNSFSFGRVSVVLKELILTVLTLRGCGNVESPGFMFLLSEGVVVLKELILTVSTLGMCGSGERTDFNTFYFGNVWQSWKN